MSDFPSEKNPQPCKNGCGTRIYLSDKKQKGRYLPYNSDDDTVHDCPNKPSNGQAPTTTKPEPPKQEFSLEAVLKKLESIGIKVNLMELMKQ